MKINTTIAIFKECKAQYPAATLTDGEADIYISIDPTTRKQYEFTMNRENNQPTYIVGGSQLSALWGFYEYLERFYGAVWISPDVKYISIEQTKPLTVLRVRYDHPYDFCWFHWQVPNKVRKWMEIQRLVSLTPHSKFQSQVNCLQEDWKVIYRGSHPEIFARFYDGEIAPINEYSKFRYDSPVFRQIVIEQLNAIDSDTVALFPPDGAQYDAYARSDKNPIHVYRGWADLSDYFGDYYTAIAKGVPNKRFYIYAYGKYDRPPKGFDGSRFTVFVTPINHANFIEWKETGAKVIFRPNSWNPKNPTSVEIFKTEVDILRQHREIGFNGFMMDGYGAGDWKTKGLRYYLTAGIMRGKTIDQLVKEYNIFAK